MTSPTTIFFSDLDGTLLDHDNYGFEPALPALQALRQRLIPVVLATSKTLAEIDPLRRTLKLDGPAIVENGGAIAWDERTNDTLVSDGTSAAYRTEFLSPAYEELSRFIDDTRRQQGYRLRGFGDMSDEDVAECTGLDLQAARLARQRQCSEPFLWDDDVDRLDSFRAQASAAGLTVTQGGRFWHLMGQHASKAIAMVRVCDQLATGDSAVTTIALGDSPNDCGMLQAADIAVIVRRYDGTHLNCQGQSRTIRTAERGPTGWHAAVMQLIRDLGL